jgi:hypothetical protein
MYAGLVARLHRTNAADGSRRNAPDDRILGRPGEIVVEIDQVVIPNAGATGTAGQDVPNRLVEAAGD